MNRMKGVGRCLQRAWVMMRILSGRFPDATREVLFEIALTYESTDLLCPDTMLVRALVCRLVKWENQDFADAFHFLLPFIKRNGVVPDHQIIEGITGCGRKSARRANLWRLANAFLLSRPALRRNQ